MKKVTESSYASVWDAIETDPRQAQNLRLRSALMIGVSEHVRRKGWTQSVAAAQCGVSQPRINDLLRGRISRFSLDALVNIATALGLQIRLEVEAA